MTVAYASTLAGLIQRLGEGEPSLDRDFARRLAQGLAAYAGNFRLPLVERLGLTDVVVTFHMDETMKLVVTGHWASGPGEAMITFVDRDFGGVEAELTATPVETPYLVATLDFSVRGHKATLREPAPPLPAGLEVVVDALATVGDKVEYRVRAHGIKVSAPPEALDFG